MHPNMITVSIESDLNQFPTERRFDPQTKILELKKKLELITGANHTSMKVILYVDDKEVTELANDAETLAHFLGEQGSKNVKLVVKDENPSLILTQEGDAPKYVISEDKYLQRPNNARNFIKEMREKRMSGASAGSPVATAKVDSQ